MDAPAAQYTTTSDGVSIAWAEAGQGPALLYFGPTPLTHVQKYLVSFEAYYDALTRCFRVVTFDARGTGMSQRDVADVSTATLLMDAEAVIEAAKLDRFVVYADTLLALSTALHLATAFSDRVTHLALEAPYQNTRELANTPHGRVGLALAEADWAVYVETLLRVLAGFDASDNAWIDPFLKVVAGWVEPFVGLQYVRAGETVDVGDLLPHVRQPTLVLRDERQAVPVQCSQRIAAKIPGAQFRGYRDPTFVEQAELICAFAGQAPPPLPGDAPTASPFRTVLFTDLVGHTEMMQRLGDERGREVLREHERITRDLLKQHGGAEVKTMGDGFMASFGSVTKAVDCAIALQRAFAAWNDGDGAKASSLEVRVGLNAGEPIEEDGDLFGSTVILASRIAAKAGAGEILIPEPLRHLLSGKSYVYSDRGATMLKGFEDAVRLYEVRWRE
ncbi:MAG: hypothetical protein M3P30_08840 [Chloroflexota bacterium]|nr:hypothetical protein [Chloroflexota bacterium]